MNNHINILIIGNGFDLAHGLPTTYSDFLNFIAYFNLIYKNPKDKNSYNDAPKFKTLNKDIQHYLQNLDQNIYLDELFKLSSNNIWINHFNKCIEKNKLKGINWIDFESEITKIIISLEYLKKYNEDNLKLTVGNRQYPHNNQIFQDAKNFLSNIKDFLMGKKLISENFEYYDIKNPKIEDKYLEDYFFYKSTAKNIITELNNELNNLIRCLEIYLDYVINDIETSITLSDINKIDKIDKVLSFNYTYTFKNIYDPNNQIEYDYIHGKANKNNSIKTNTMVLGIDEYLTDDNKNKELDFIQFKNIFKGYIKKTGCIYKNWIEDIKNQVHNGFSKAFYNKIFIYGHSLDITDKDILKELILLPRTQITIFYLDETDYIEKISNMVKLIGQDELIASVYGKNPSVIFKKIIK